MLNVYEQQTEKFFLTFLYSFLLVDEGVLDLPEKLVSYYGLLVDANTRSPEKRGLLSTE